MAVYDFIFILATIKQDFLYNDWHVVCSTTALASQLCFSIRYYSTSDAKHRVEFWELRIRHRLPQTAPRLPRPSSSDHQHSDERFSEVCTDSSSMLPNAQSLRSRMSSEGHHATAASPVRAAPHIAGDHYHEPITAGWNSSCRWPWKYL